MMNHSELAYSWPAIPFGGAVVVVLIRAFTGATWAAPIGLALMAASFGPCCWLRDWWVRR